MRPRRVGTKPEFRLFQNERPIGHVDDTSVSFVGFETRDDAALAASEAHRTLTRRRRKRAHRMEHPADFLIMDQDGMQAVVARAGILAKLLPPAPEGAVIDGWGFEIQLLPEERFEVSAVARARLIWRALRSSGIYRRMRQFFPMLRSRFPPDEGRLRVLFRANSCSGRYTDVRGRVRHVDSSVSVKQGEAMLELMTLYLGVLGGAMIAESPMAPARRMGGRQGMAPRKLCSPLWAPPDASVRDAGDRARVGGLEPGRSIPECT